MINPATRAIRAARCKAWREKNREQARASVRRSMAKHPEKNLAKALKWAKENPERVAATKARWYNNNRDKARKASREYVARRRETDDNFRIRASLRGRIWQALKAQGLRKSKSTVELTGCPIRFLRAFLEVQFLHGMTWDNYGKWHIDHRIPCAEFDLRNAAQQKQCFDFKNLQPMWGPDNIRKGAKRPAAHQTELL